MEVDIKKIGLVGGVGWPATILYYEGLCKAAQADMPGGSPVISIESLNMYDTLALRGTAYDAQSWAGYDATFRQALMQLVHSGCEVTAIASVTPHARLVEYLAGVEVPVVSILDATADVAATNGLTSAIVLGTPVTMGGTWFEAALEDVGIECPICAQSSDIDEVQNLLERYFYPGKAIDGRGALLTFCKRINPQPDRTAIILACTDFSAALPEFATDAVFSVDGLTFLDAGTAHVQAILNAAKLPD